MILWGRPYAFWALLVVIAVGVAVWRLLSRRREQLAAFADAGLLDRLVVGLVPGRRNLRLLLRVAALTSLVCAAAAPRWGFRWEEVRREGIDLIVALDTSRSMLAADVAPNRLERAKLAVMDLVGRLDGDRVGLVAFAGTAFLECPLTLDYAAFERTLRAVHVGIIPRGGTALARAIDESLESFDARQGKYQALILITDGEDHEGDVEEAAKRAAEAGVKIFTIGIGTSEGELLPSTGAGGYFKDRQGNVVKSRLDESALGTIASTSGGAHVRGLGPSLGLDEVFRDHIANMERRDVGSRLERRWEERFQIPLALALLLLLVESAIGDAHARPLRRVRERFLRTAAAVLIGIVLLGNLTVSAHAAEDPGPTGYEQYLKGDYAGAAERWREGLIDEPDSPLLRFNLGAALFREGKFDEAAQAFAKVATAGDATWTAKAAYNLGNTLYRKGQAAESSDPKAAIEAWEQSLEAYRSAMSADPADDDPKFDYELVSKRLRALREKLEKEAQQQQDQQQPQDQQQEQQPQDQQQQQDQKDQQQQGEQAQQDQQDQQAEQPPPEQQQAGEEQPQDQGAEQQQAENAQDEQAPQEDGGEQQPQEAAGQPPQQDAGEQGRQGEQDGQAAAQEAAPEPGEQDQAAEQGEQAGDAAAQPGDKNDAPPAGEGTPLAGAEGEAPDEQAARAVLDTVRREELGPDDVNRVREAGSGVAEAFKDW